MLNDLFIFIFGNLMEAFLMMIIALKLFKVEVSTKKLLIMIILYGSLVFTVRKIYTILEIPFGTHSLILVTLLVLILRFIGNSPWLYAIPGAIVPFALVMMGSPMSYKAVLFFGWEHEVIFKTAWMLIILAYTEMIYLFTAALFLQITKFNIPAVLKLRK